MTPIERCRAVLGGGLPDRVPVLPQAFLFALEVSGTRMGAVRHDARRMAAAQKIAIEKFGYDGCVVDFDVCTLAEACGAKVQYRDDAPAILDESALLVTDYQVIGSLRVPNPYRDGRLPVWLETTRLLADSIGDEVFIMGRADQGPFSLACMLRGTEQFFVDLLDESRHEQVHSLIDYCRRACAAFAKAQKDVGAHATSIGDAFSGPSVISPSMSRRFALAAQTRLAAEVQEYGCPLSIHVCGNTKSILADLGSTGASILELDWPVDFGKARSLIPARTVLMGNINPSDPMVLGTPEAVDAAARRIIESTGGAGLFLSSGCALGRETPPENMAALVNAAKRYMPVEPLRAAPAQDR